MRFITFIILSTTTLVSAAVASDRSPISSLLTKRIPCDGPCLGENASCPGGNETCCFGLLCYATSLGPFCKRPGVIITPCPCKRGVGVDPNNGFTDGEEFVYNPVDATSKVAHNGFTDGDEPEFEYLPDEGAIKVARDVLEARQCPCKGPEQRCLRGQADCCVGYRCYATALGPICR